MLRTLLALLFSAFLLHSSSLPAISVGTTEADTSPEAELKSFTVLDGFEVSLWASEKDGLTKPISMRWDERGRLWVITAKSYPQPQPGEVADDKVLILEDTKHAGHADKVTVFADGLRMPMGIELAPSATWPNAPEALQGAGSKEHGEASRNSGSMPHAPSSVRASGAAAAYIGEGEKLWIMRDLDGDGKADVREVVFSGFGTGDTHQCINSFTWTPDGALLFSQGLHCYSNVTTPWGGRKLYGAGFWTYRPLRAELTPYPTGFPLNAWGTVYDDAGQPFSVAGAAGMFWTTPLLVPQYGDGGGEVLPPSSDAKDRRVRASGYSVHLIEGRALPNNGQIVKQGMLKYCGVDIPRNAHWPADMHGELVSGGFFENCIYRHKLQPDKQNPSGYEAVRQPDLIKSSSVAFRPVDVKFGPDGALYISDWYNPIIGHYQASFRHPDRDKTHGRIWRVVKKGDAHTSELLRAESTTIRGLVYALDESEWMQYQAQRLLMAKPKDAVFAAIDKAFKASPTNKLPNSRWFYYYLWAPLRAREWFESTDEDVLREALALHPPEQGAPLPVKTIGLWQDRLKDPLGLLEKAIADEDPRVRLEAIAACSHIPQPQSIAIALRALAKPMDSFLDRTLELTVHALAPHWEPALRDGKLSLPPKHLAWLLDKKSDGDTLAAVRALVHQAERDTGSLPVQEAPPAGKTPPPPTGWQPVSHSAKLDPESRRALLLMLAKRGGEEDVAAALSQGVRDAMLLNDLADLVESQQIKAPKNAQSVLAGKTSLFGSMSGGVLEFDDMVMLPAGARLVGLWKLSSLAPQLKAQVVNFESSNVDSKRACLIALARLNTEHDLISQVSADDKQPYAVRASAVEALAMTHITPAAKAALALMPQAKTEEDMRALLAPFLVKAGRVKPLITAITETPPSKEAADLASRALAMMGRNEPELSAALNKILGRTAAVMPYDAQWVSGLANEATVVGNAKKGDEIFHRPTMACTGCHQINNVGGIIGPQLDAVGRGVPVELLVEAVMWPQRQIKEGYVATTVVMKDGRTIVGYKSKETDTELTVRDMATKVETTLQKKQLQSRTDAGSLMPDGLTASLNREELRDLIAYLASLGKEEKK